MAIEPKLMTAEDLLILPDDGMRHELIDGELRSMPPPGGAHGEDGFVTTVHLGHHIITHRLGRGFAAETGFLIRREPVRVRAPDFAFIRANRLPPGRLPTGYLTIAPDLVVEVVSPGDTAGEVQEKVEEWLRFGTGAVWVVYEGPRLVAHSPDNTARTYGSNDEIDGGEVLPGFRMRVRDLVGPPVTQRSRCSHQASTKMTPEPVGMD